MSRSRKLPIRKDTSGGRSRYKSSQYYWRKVRSRQNQAVREGKEEIPNEKTIVNDYTYCDWIFDYRFHRGKYWEEKRKKMSRK